MFIREDRNGTKYFKETKKCIKCCGTGKIAEFLHIQDGMCFDCNGSGIIETIRKEYTEEYKKKMEVRKIAKMKKREQEWRDKVHSENQKFFQKEGFNSEGTTYIVTSSNSYEVKEMLKEEGYKYNGILGWHGSEPSKCVKTVPLQADQVYQKNQHGIFIDWYKDDFHRVKEEIEAEFI